MYLHIDTVLNSKISFSSFFSTPACSPKHIQHGAFHHRSTVMHDDVINEIAKDSRDAFKKLTKAAITGELLRGADLLELTSRCQLVGLFGSVQAPTWRPRSQCP